MHRAWSTVIRGASAGFLGGVGMGIALLWRAAGHDMSMWSSFLQIAAFWVGVEALVAGTEVVALGVGTHLAVSMALGIVFTSLTRRPSVVAGVASGLLFGTAVWFVMTWVLLPIVDPVLVDRVRWRPVEWFLVHLVFGAVLGGTPSPARRRRPRGPAPVTP